MSATVQKKFGKSTREVPTEKAQKWYPAEDQYQPKKARLFPISFSSSVKAEQRYWRCHQGGEFAVPSAIAIAPSCAAKTNISWAWEGEESQLTEYPRFASPSARPPSAQLLLPAPCSSSSLVDSAASASSS